MGPCGHTFVAVIADECAFWQSSASPVHVDADLGMASGTTIRTRRF